MPRRKRTRVIESSEDESSELSGSFIVNEIESDMDEQYWASDFKPLAKEILASLSKNLKRGKKRESEKLLIDLLKKKEGTTLELFCDGKTVPKDDSWKIDLTEEEIKTLEPKLEQIREAIENNEPTIKKILSANIPDHIQKKCIEYFDILQKTERFTEDYMEMREKINTLIRDHSISIEHLDKINNIGESNEISLENKILSLDTDEETIAKIYRMLKHFSTLSENSEQYHTYKKELDYVTSLPFDSVKEMPNICSESEYLHEVGERLDERLFGMDDVKEHILEILNNKLTSNDSRGMCLGLVGEPGTGKTSVAEAIAYALDLPFDKVSLGGAIDVTVIKGSQKVWMGAEPGNIAKFLMNSGVSNGVFLFDEVDKLGESDKGKDVQNALLHISDYNHNSKFKDDFINGVDIDLSRMWFIFSLNSTEGLSKALLDRITMIEVDNYTFKEKCQIAERYIIPRILKSINIENDLTFTQEAIEKICVNNPSGGMRSIEKYLHGLISKINLKRRFDERYQFPFRVTEGIVNTIKVTSKTKSKIPFGMYT